MRSAFTLIELLIVVAVSAMLSGLVITYSSVGRNGVALSIQLTALAQTLARAKSLAIASYGGAAGHACGYGIAFDVAANTYSLVSYQPISGKCQAASAVRASGIGAGDLVSFSPETWQQSLGGGVHFSATGSKGNALRLVLFYPPEPATLLSTDLCNAGDTGCVYGFAAQPGTVYLATSDGAASQVVTVSTAGQINW